MLAKASGEHAEKAFVYGLAMLFVFCGALSTTWNWLLWAIYFTIQCMVLPAAAAILVVAAAKRIFNIIVERLPTGGGAGR